MKKVIHPANHTSENELIILTFILTLHTYHPYRIGELYDNVHRPR